MNSLLPLGAASLALSGCVIWRADDGGVLASEVVGPEGQRIEAPGLVLDVPAGALAVPTEITIRIVEPDRSIADLYSPIYKFEPEGLVFDRPIHVTVDATGAPATAIVMWTRDDDPSVFEFAGFVEGGVGVAEVTHFSECVVADPAPCTGDACAACTGPECETVPDPECPDEGTGETCSDEACGAGASEAAEACAADAAEHCGEEPCRSICRCASSATGADVCSVDPAEGTTEYEFSQTQARCPADNPTLGDSVDINGSPSHPNGYDMAGERNDAACNGYEIVTTYGVVCDCVGSATMGFLCTRAWEEIPPGSGSVGCNTMMRLATDTADAPAPEPWDSPSGVTAFIAATGPDLNAADYEGGACAGHWERILPDGRETDGGVARGRLANCAVAAVASHWEEATGTYRGCSRFSFPEGAAGLSLSQEDQTRCRLTEEEWQTLGDARSNCGVPARATLPADERRTAAVLRVPGRDPIVGLNGRTPTREGTSQWNRANMSNAMCPPPGPRTATSSDGMERRFRGGGMTHCHAEGDALEQLAVASGRTPPVPIEGMDQSGWYSVGDTRHESAELLVDRAPCRGSCAPYGLDRLRQTAGVDDLTVRSPSGTYRFRDGAGSRGEWVD